MKRYRIVAEYTVKKEMFVSIPDGAVPTNPASWVDIESEHDMDCSLNEVLRAEEAGADE